MHQSESGQWQKTLEATRRLCKASYAHKKETKPFSINSPHMNFHRINLYCIRLALYQSEKPGLHEAQGVGMQCGALRA